MLLSAIVSVGILVKVNWRYELDYHGCVGKLHRIEYIEELGHAITILKDVKCPNGSKKEYVGTVIGIRLEYLEPANSSD
jgi:hypothetical protein